MAIHSNAKFHGKRENSRFREFRDSGIAHTLLDNSTKTGIHFITLYTVFSTMIVFLIRQPESLYCREILRGNFFTLPTAAFFLWNIASLLPLQERVYKERRL